MTNILQVLLGLALVNYVMFDAVFSEQPKGTRGQPTHSKVVGKTWLSAGSLVWPLTVLNKSLSLAAATTTAFLLTLVFSNLLEQFVLLRVTNRLLSTLSFIVTLTAALQVIALVLARRHLLSAFVPAILLPLIFANCVVMGVTMPNNIELGTVLVAGLARCSGFAVVLVLFTLLRERLAGADIPAAFQGTATTLLVAALVSMTFMGFAGL